MYYISQFIFPFIMVSLPIIMHTDINECASSNGGCAQFCNNTVGLFFCDCNEGYLLDIDDINCDGMLT